LETLGRIFDIDLYQLEVTVGEVVLGRMSLPGRLGGMGVTSYTELADAAYVGCIANIGSRLVDRLGSGLEWNQISGLEEAYMNLQEQLGKDDETLPERGELFLNLQVQQPRPTGNQNSFFDLRLGQARKRVGLQSRLAAKLHELRHKRVQKEAEADQGMLYTLEATSNEMCGDILFVRLTNRSNRMGRDFKTVVRKYLGLPVAKSGCSLGKCQDEPVHWNGAHGYHASTLVTYRHHGVKQAISGIVESLQNVGQFPYACQQERSMKDLGMETNTSDGGKGESHWKPRD
jgi:hypothetical protein